MQKRLNLVYEWIGPKGPITNNRIPTIVDLIDRQTNANLDELGIRHDLIQQPHFHTRIPSSKIVPACNLPDGIFLYELNFNNYHYRDLMRAFHHSDGLLDHNCISQTVLDRIKQRTGYLLVTLLYEGHVQDHFISSMTSYFRSKGIPLSQVIYLNNCYNGTEIYADYCRRANQTPEMNLAYLPVFRVDKTDIMTVLNNPVTYVPGHKKKLFLCFNRRYNEHRVLFYTMMSKLGLLDKFYMSMAATQPENSRSFVENAKYFAANRPGLQITEEDISAAERPLPLTLDNTNFNSYPMERGPAAVASFYNDSYINIVNETYFFNNIIHLTEKTFKPIAFKQPFIMIAAPGSLRHVKDMGFKTFDEFWDEKYDLEYDHDKRFKMILDLITDISTWNEDRLLEFTNKVKPILEHNFMRIKTMPNIEVDNLVNKYGA
mgnify:CR=1 FL=1